MILAVASGKGGTGKTLVAVSLALAGSKAGLGPLGLVDCDVEAPNAALFLNPALAERRDGGLPVPEVNEWLCTACGRCVEVCAFNAVALVANRVLVFRELCHGCGSCAHQCPEGAIRERLYVSGVLERGTVGTIRFAQGRLAVGQAMASPLIRQLKRWVLGNRNGLRHVILDGPPGTACSLVQTVQGCDFALLVTEPTPFGLHDLRQAVEVIRGAMGIPVGVVLNRDGDGGSRVERYCESEGLPILMRIPFDREIAHAYSEGVPLVQALPEYGPRFEKLFGKILEAAGR